MTEVLCLDESLYVASGAERHVYLHPHDDDKLVKVMRPDAVPENRRMTFRDITTRLFPSVRLRLIRKEYDEYMRVWLRNFRPNIRVPITHMFGLAPTNLGLACITERVSNEEGGLGQTLAQKVKTNTLTDEDVKELNRLVAAFYDLGIRAGDIKPHNLVFGHRGNGYECVLVDGFGDIHAIPVRSMGRWANTLGLNDSFRIVARRTGLIWDKRARQFRIS